MTNAVAQYTPAQIQRFIELRRAAGDSDSDIRYFFSLEGIPLPSELLKTEEPKASKPKLPDPGSSIANRVAGKINYGVGTLAENVLGGASSAVSGGFNRVQRFLEKDVPGAARTVGAATRSRVAR